MLITYAGAAVLAAVAHDGEQGRRWMVARSSQMSTTRALVRARLLDSHPGYRYTITAAGAAVLEGLDAARTAEAFASILKGPAHRARLMAAMVAKGTPWPVAVARVGSH